MNWLSGTVCAALSVVFLLAAVVAGRRRRPRAAMRWFGVALLPVGIWLAGLVTAARRIGEAIASWAAHVVFDPRVWAGVILIGVGILVLLASGLRRRGGDESGKAVPSSPPPPAAAPGTRAKAVPAKSGRTKGGAAEQDDDLKEIEEILKRRGI
jgi:hypothetical protein